MHGLSPDEEIDYWRQRAERAEKEVGRMRAVYEAAKTWCETVYVGKPHPRFPAYPGDELLLAVNSVKHALAEGGERE